VSNAKQTQRQQATQPSRIQTQQTNTVTRKLMQVFSIGTDGTTTTSSRYTGLLGGYNQTPAISSITLLVDAGTMTSGTVLLYGVK
jgi:hypothetical protein